MACDLIKLFPGRKEQDNGTRLGERTRKKRRQNKEKSLKWKMTEEWENNNNKWWPNSFFRCFNQTLVCVRPAREQRTSVWRVLKTSLVWFSSQLSWRSTCILSRWPSWHHHSLTSAVRDDTDRSGWRNDSPGTTRLLYRTQHSYRSRCHCPDLWW